MFIIFELLKTLVMREKKIKKHPNVEHKIYAVLSDKSSKRWQGVDKISEAIGVKSMDIFRVINESGKFVLSSNKQQQPVIATRERYRKEEPFLRKLLDVLKNKTD